MISMDVQLHARACVHHLCMHMHAAFVCCMVSVLACMLMLHEHLCMRPCSLRL